MSSWQPRFRKALDQEFNDQSLTLLVSDYFAPKDSPKIAPPGAGNFEYRVYLLMEEARMEGWLYELVAAARERRPRSANIAAISEELGLTTTGPRLSNIVPNKTLEAVVQQNALPRMSVSLVKLIRERTNDKNVRNGNGTNHSVTCNAK